MGERRIRKIAKIKITKRPYEIRSRFRFLFNKFEESYTPTIEDFHRKLYRIRGEVHQLDLLDTSGNHPFPAMRRLSFLTGKSIGLPPRRNARLRFKQTSHSRRRKVLAHIPAEYKNLILGNDNLLLSRWLFREKLMDIWLLYEQIKKLHVSERRVANAPVMHFIWEYARLRWMEKKDS